MKKVFATFCMAAALMGMSSCASGSKADISQLSGEWNIVEINGTAVSAAAGEEAPYIAFNTQTGEISGFTGCNRLVGTIDVKAKAGTIDLSGLGSTKMMCPDMTVEDNLFKAMAQTKGYKKLDADNVALCDASNEPVIVLKKR